MSIVLRVVSVGKDIPNAGFVSNLKSLPYVFSNGYCIERSVFNAAPSATAKTAPVFLEQMSEEEAKASEFTDVYFTATVEMSPDKKPLFTVTRSDKPESKRYGSTKSPQEPWVSAMQDAKQDFPLRENELLPLPRAMSGFGARMYGVNLKEVKEKVMALPGIHAPDVTTALAAIDMGVNPPSSQAEAEAEAKPATATRKRQRSEKAKKKEEAEKEETEANETADKGEKPPPKRRRKKASDAETPAPVPTAAAADAVPPAAAPSLACPDCGLTNTPFCAATGKRHAVAAPCPLCGLTTTYCAMTGKPHEGSGQAAGAVKKTRKRSTAKAAAATEAAATVPTEVQEEGTVVGSQKKSGRKGTPKEKSPKKEKNTEAKKERKPRAKKGSATASAPTPSPATTGEAAEAGAAAAAPQPPVPDTNTLLSFLRPQEPEVPKAYEYPPLRPPLSASDHHKSAALLAKSLKEKEEQSEGGAGLAPALSSQIPFQMRLVKKTVTRGRRKKSAVAGAAAAAADNDNGNNNEGDNEEDNTRGETSEKTHDEGPVSTSGFVHPLEVFNVGTSAAGKRLVKFLTQYTSERAMADALRAASKSATAASGATPSKKVKKEELADTETAAAAAVDEPTV